MSNPIYDLAKLNPHIMPWDKIMGFRLTSSANPLEVAGNLAGLKIDAYIYGLYYFCDHRDLFDRVVTIVEKEVNKRAEINHWHFREVEQKTKLCQLAILEDMTNNICPACKNSDLLKVKCKKCDGVGVVKIKDSQRAKFTGFDSANWSRRWKARYEHEVYGYICELKHDIIAHLRAKMRY